MCPVTISTPRTSSDWLSSIHGRATGQVVTDTGSFLKDLDLFDHREFGVTAKDAKCMPVGLRKLIHVTSLSLQDSGIDYRGRNVGCYMSGVAHDFYAVSGHVRLFFSFQIALLRGLLMTYF